MRVFSFPSGKVLPLRAACAALFVCILALPLSALAGPIRAKSAILYDLDKRVVLYEQNADARVPPASLTKILSMYLVMRNRKVQKNSRYLKKRMLLEMRNPVYRQLSAGMKVLFFGLLAGCSFPPFRALWVMKQKICHTY